MHTPMWGDKLDVLRHRNPFCRTRRRPPTPRLLSATCRCTRAGLRKPQRAANSGNSLKDNPGKVRGDGVPGGGGGAHTHTHTSPLQDFAAPDRRGNSTKQGTDKSKRDIAPKQSNQAASPLSLSRSSLLATGTLSAFVCMRAGRKRACTQTRSSRRAQECKRKAPSASHVAAPSLPGGVAVSLTSPTHFTLNRLPNSAARSRRHLSLSRKPPPLRDHRLPPIG